MTTDWSADLDEFVEGDDALPEDEPLLPIEGQEEADIWLRRLARLRTDAADISSLAAARISHYVEWRDDRLSGVSRDIERIERHVEMWARAVISGRRRSVSLPWGTPSLSKPRRSIVVHDDAAFEEWALANDHENLLRPAATRQPDKILCAEHLVAGPEIEQDDDVSYRALVDSDGRRAPGVMLAHPLRDSFSIRAPRSADDTTKETT